MTSLEIPVGVLGRPEEVAETVLWMVKTGYVTNKVIAVDGKELYPHIRILSSKHAEPQQEGCLSNEIKYSSRYKSSIIAILMAWQAVCILKVPYWLVFPACSV